MEEAYEAALKQLGGLDNAKPKAVYDLLAHEFPVLSVQVRLRGHPAAPWSEGLPSAGASPACGACGCQAEVPAASEARLLLPSGPAPTDPAAASLLPCRT